ncbi:MAG: exopolysaccharide biosynthesis protein [Alphaproteobacteria bacterium]
MTAEVDAENVSGPTPKRTSDVLIDFAKQTEGDVTIGELIDALKDRGFGILIVLFALPGAVLPIAWILGTPILFFASQLILALPEPWLPEFLRCRGLKQDTFKKVIEYAVRYLGYIEVLLKPRWTWMAHPIMERFIGAYIVFAALVLLVPIVPWGNFLPAFGVGLMAAGLLEKDGLAITVGAVMVMIGAFYVFAFLGGAWIAFAAIFGL